ncbi:uncharacterized protein [Aristolochia californica]|uniref:uncharacterized protein n=1 Tax=Aristolochia californica TaxID=171875 RepID=UPI0035DA71D0
MPLQSTFPSLHNISRLRNSTISEIADNGGWNIQPRRDLSDLEGLEASQQLDTFSVYLVIRGEITQGPKHAVEFTWRLSAPPKIKFFMWSACHNKILYADNLRIRGNRGVDPICPFCHAHEETISHLLLLCPFSWGIWTLILNKIGLQLCFPEDLSATCRMLVGTPISGIGKLMIFAISAFIPWGLWLERNHRRFNAKPSTQDRVIETISDSIATWLHSRKAFSPFSGTSIRDNWRSLAQLHLSSKPPVICEWTLPSAGVLKLNFDGSSLDSTTVELQSVLNGLRVFRDHCSGPVLIEGDSKVVIGWCQHASTPPWRHWDAFFEVLDIVNLLECFWSLIPRSANSVADALAKQGASLQFLVVRINCQSSMTLCVLDVTDHSKFLEIELMLLFGYILMTTVSNCGLVQVEGDGSFVPASEDDFLEVEHLLAVPDDETILEDDVLCFESKNSEKFLLVDDVPCSDDCHQLNTDSGALDCSIMQDGKQEPKFDFLDSILQGLNDDSVDDTAGLSSECADYLLGIGMGSLQTGELAACFGEKDVGVTEMSDLSNAVVPLPNQSTTLLDKMTIRELHETFQSTFGRDTSVKDKQWLKRRILFGLQNFMELKNVSGLIDSGPSSNDNEDNLLFTAGSRALLESKDINDILKPNFSVGETTGYQGSNLEDEKNRLLTLKRQRKPTRRYIEESSDVTCRHSSGKLETPHTSSMDKILQFRSHNQQVCRRGFRTEGMIGREDIVARSATENHKPRRGRGRPRKNFRSLVGHDSNERKEHELLSVFPTINPALASSQYESPDEDVSDDNILVRRSGKAMRRKHHRLWNLSEVMKLIEGVSRFGVGRWTDIKRLLFATSAHRTSVDLKDKWRNLLRASSVQIQNKKEVEQRKKHASLPIPHSVLCRVRELAIIYPYPRDRKSKLAQTAAATAANTLVAAAPSTFSDTAISRSGRVVHRKNFM